MAPAHRSGCVSEYIEKRTKESRIVLGFINGGLTYVLQVCDLVSNKEFKAIIKNAYMKWRAKFLMAERAKTPKNKFRRIKIKIQVDTMTDTAEESTKALNYGEHTSRYIKKDFRFARQDPRVERKNGLVAHIYSLAKLKLYQMVDNVLEHRTPGKIPVADELEEEEKAAF